jgi:hypothetical protein
MLGLHSFEAGASARLGFRHLKIPEADRRQRSGLGSFGPLVKKGQTRETISLVFAKHQFFGRTASAVP